MIKLYNKYLNWLKQGDRTSMNILLKPFLLLAYWAWGEGLDEENYST